VTPSSELTAISAVRGALGNTHARGRTHTTYQGISQVTASSMATVAQPAARIQSISPRHAARSSQA